MDLWQHFKAFASLPFMAVFGVTVILLIVTQQFHIGWYLPAPLNFIPTIVGCLLIALGVYLLAITTYFFAKIGGGTVAHWSPPTKLVIHGIYRYVRNPMVLGVVLTVLGETIFFGSISMFVLFLVLFIGNHILFIKYEEPNLIKRFGDDYREYMKNVPRWLPRLKPWDNTLMKN
jgi:protein-S-isoprenylcysteine O-methyltransferase Ste14